MPAFYWMEFYIDPKNRNLAQLVQDTLNALIQSGCRFKRVMIPHTEDYSLPQMKRRYSFETRNISFDEATKIAIADLEARAAGASRHSHLPVDLVFLFDFEFDERVWKKHVENPKTKDPDEVREVSLAFWYFRKHQARDKIMVGINPWEEYVLMYGETETHRRNKLMILKIAELVYNGIQPFFAWMDGEMGSSDQSLDLLLNGNLPVGNEFVMVGPTMMSHLNIDHLRASSYPWKTLSDSGIIIQNPYRFETAEPRLIP